MRFLPLALVLLLLAGQVAPAAADGPLTRATGIFADPAGTIRMRAVPGFFPFNFYVLGFGLDGQVKGWELSVSLDPAFLILGRTLDQPGSLNVGGADNWIVGSGGCFDGSSVYTFVTYQAGYFAGPVAPNDALFCLGPSDPSSFSPASPGYLQCSGSLVPMGTTSGLCPCTLYPIGCLVINPSDFCIVETLSTSFGEVKAGF